MLSDSENELLTRIGPGTPAGELMRRYWQPVAAASQLTANPVRRIRILGEDLTLFRDRKGGIGLIGQRCLHRAVDLRYGIPDEGGLRCPYHGWLYDETGQCTDTPLEPEESKFKTKLKTKGYPVQELGGLVWAYLGPLPAPILPQWDLLVWPNTFRQIGGTMLDCNWLQCVENAVDAAHTVYTHGCFWQYVLERKGVALDADGLDPSLRRAVRATQFRPIKLAFEPFEHGIIKRRLREGQDPDQAKDWQIGHPLVFPNMVRLAGGFRNEMRIRVPVDDTHTWQINYQTYTPGEKVPVEQDEISYYEVPTWDENGEPIVDFVSSQDMLMWWSQGDLTDRSIERLGAIDVGVILYRKMLKQQIQIAGDGGDPINVFRDPAMDRRIDLPVGWKPGEVNEWTQSSGSNLARLKLNKGYVQDDIERYSPALDQVFDIYERAVKAGVLPE